MHEEAATLCAIAAMAAVTLGCRCGGYFLFSRIKPSPRLRMALGHLPGCIFAAYVIPSLLAGPAQNIVGALATLAVMAAFRSLGLSIAAGVAATWVASLAI
jgi:uncharacterized membrane protein